MEKFVINDGTFFEIQKGAYLGNVCAVVNSFAELETVAGILSKDGNLDEVQFMSDDIAGAQYTNMALELPMFHSVDKVDGKVFAAFSLRPITEEEKQTEENKMQVQMAIAYLTDEQALTVKDLYPTFTELIGKTVKIGTRFTYNTFLFKTLQDNLLIQEQYVPGNGTESLYVQLDESHAGTLEDPIPWVPNMQPEKEKYYSEGNLVAKCIEDPGQPLYNKLSELCPGRYFEAVE